MTDENTTKIKTTTQMPGAAARAVVAGIILECEGGQTFTFADIAPVMKRTGYGRRWLYKVLSEIEAEKLIYRDKSGDKIKWVVTTNDDDFMRFMDKHQND